MKTISSVVFNETLGEMKDNVTQEQSMLRGTCLLLIRRTLGGELRMWIVLHARRMMRSFSYSEMCNYVNGFKLVSI